MLILSRVCAEFRDGAGAVLFRVAPKDRLTLLEAPDAIRNDPLFDLLLAEGSLEAVASAERRRQLENDPALGIDASGKRLTPDTEDRAGAGGKRPAPGTESRKPRGEKPSA